MVLRSTLLLRMAARAAPKPKYASRPAAAAAQAAMQAPAPQPPPPQPVPPPASANDGSSGGAAGGGLGYQLLLAFGSVFGMFMAFSLVSRLFGPRQISVVHKDQYGNVIDPQTGRPR
eukprot:gnl/TRDRNA2_/TRDRNA2_39284_c0_seq1.p2 gnl/TRDRNA2_/TRDRNA2_39284_c0~~gnl/TRDRNA2_/TRDRNA2_39284_c0_seq1.p2  ORF type:complete len:117 (+),score=24.74 gnl/TRDRNA2_/TRDRNA2_39284_c0_seq1:90-440(+)